MTAHVQRFKDGWLLGETRSGRAIIYDAAGKPTGSEFDLGDASEDIQVSENGAIWVSYFDEGVFGGGVGNAGLVCFNSVGQVIFRYSDFAEHHKLPPVDDLYALNVVDESDVWISYYSDFPLVRIRNWKEAEVWNDFGPTKCISVSGPMVVSARAYEKGRLNRSILTNAVWNHEELIPVDFQGATISPPFRAWARRDRMCLLTNTKIYSCVISDITELSS
jgi:hypothetical protein